MIAPDSEKSECISCHPDGMYWTVPEWSVFSSGLPWIFSVLPRFPGISIVFLPPPLHIHLPVSHKREPFTVDFSSCRHYTEKQNVTKKADCRAVISELKTIVSKEFSR